MPKNMRHVVDVMRPTKAIDTLGVGQAAAETIIKDWPCSIESLTGREAESARQTFASATLKVEGYGNPARTIRETDYLQFGSRRLFVGFVNDKQQNGVELSLVCGEER